MSISPVRSYHKGVAQYKHPRSRDDFLRDSLLGNTIVKLGVDRGIGL